MSFKLLRGLLDEYEKHFKEEGIDPKDVVVSLRVGDSVIGAHVCTYDPDGLKPVTMILWSKGETPE